MPTLDTPRILGSVEHPALGAWRAFGGSPWRDCRVQGLKYDDLDQLHKSHVFRLEGAGPRGEAIIAKLCTSACAALEQTIYESVLPRLSGPSLRSYGVAESEVAGMSWLFLEDAGDAACRMAEHGERVAAWLAELHAVGPTLDVLAELPDRGPAGYRAQLESALARIHSGRSHPALAPPDHTVLDRVERQLERARERWDQLAVACSVLPETVVHGDLVAKNLRMRSGPGRAGWLCVFDWEVAGRGRPAPDLFEAGIGASLRLLEAYRAATGAFGTPPPERAVVAAAAAGRIFRLVASIDWSCESLEIDWLGKSIGCLEKYATRLEDALGDPAWWS